MAFENNVRKCYLFSTLIFNYFHIIIELRFPYFNLNVFEVVYCRFVVCGKALMNLRSIDGNAPGPALKVERK